MLCKLARIIQYNKCNNDSRIIDIINFALVFPLATPEKQICFNKMFIPDTILNLAVLTEFCSADSKKSFF